MHKYFVIILIGMVLPGFGQNWNDLSPSLQSKIKLRWSKITPTSIVHFSDSSFLNGQILFPTDSGIIWRNGPQYLPYEASKPQLIPYENISYIRIDRSGRLLKHVINGGLIGASILATYTYAESGYFRRMNPDIWTRYTLGGFLGGASIGALSGLLIDHMRRFQLIDRPSRHKMRKVGFLKNTLYTYRRDNYWHKYWVENDSIIKDYAVPLPLDKLKMPRSRNLTFEINMGRRTKLEIPFIIPNGNISNPNYYSHHTPTFLDYRLAYQVNHFLKAGIHTQKINNDPDFFEYNWTQRGLRLSADISQRIKYDRSYGAFVEYIPFPARYMALRRWEISLGVGVIREKGRFERFFSSSYSIENPINNSQKFYDISTGSYSDFSIIGANGYLGLSIYPHRNFSIETRFGYYHLPRITAKAFTIGLTEPYNDIIVPAQSANISQAWLTMGAELKLF